LLLGHLILLRLQVRDLLALLLFARIILGAHSARVMRRPADHCSGH
jgi:hypothetical protein